MPITQFCTMVSINLQSWPEMTTKEGSIIT
jgi:hypothetical protein